MRLFQKILIILLLCFPVIAIAENYHPISYELLSKRENGELICSQTDICYFIQHNWANENVTIYSWLGIERQDASGRVLNSTSVIKSISAGKNLAFVAFADGEIFFEIIDSSLQTVIKNSLFQTESSAGISADITYLPKIKLFLISVSGNLYQYYFDSNQPPTLISSSTESIAINEGNQNQAAFLVSHQDAGFLNIIDKSGLRRSFSRLQLSNMSHIFWPDSLLYVITGLSDFSNSLVVAVNSYTAAVGSSFWIEAPHNLIDFYNRNERDILCFLMHSEESYSLNINIIGSRGIIDKISKIVLPSKLIEPLLLKEIDGIIYAIFSNALVTVNSSGEIESLDYFPFIQYFHNSLDIQTKDNKIIIISKSNSIIFEAKNNNFWIVNKIIHRSGKFLFPVLLVIVTILIIQLYRHQKRLLMAVTNLPTAGALIVIDKNGNLVRLNNLARDMISIRENIPLRKPFEFYFPRESLKPILSLIEKSFYNREKITSKISIAKGNDVKEWFCNIVVLRNITGNFRGIVFSGIDITEQIERKRLSNWAQLAHDMQTNLSTIKLNAEQLDLSFNENQTRREKIIHQVNLLIQRVRDVVTVGRSDEIHKQQVNSEEICREVSLEFDEIVFPEVEFEIDAENYLVYCDRQKLIRALRNAIENGIRSLPDRKGKITIKSNKDGKFAQFSIIDTGKGMDDRVKKKVLTPYFTTSKKEGGAGIGTMIMQHVMELHGGKLIIDSEKNKGTEITFRFPNIPPAKKNENNK